jgi:hypothetical protein
MRFMMIVIPKDYATASPDIQLDPAAVEKMMGYNQELLDAGIVVGMESLHPPSVDGARVSFESGTPVVVDGPFTEAKEVIGGFWILDLPSREEAVAWAKKAPMPAGETIEIRRLHEMTDFPEEVQEAAKDFDEQWRQKGG